MNVPAEEPSLDWYILPSTYLPLSDMVTEPWAYSVLIGLVVPIPTLPVVELTESLLVHVALLLRP